MPCHRFSGSHTRSTILVGRGSVQLLCCHTVSQVCSKPLVLLSNAPSPPPVTPIVRPCPPHAAPCRGRHHGPVVTAAMAAAVYSWHPKDSPNAGLSPLYRLIRARVLGWHCLASLSPPATRRIASPRQSFRLRHIIELLNSPTLTRAGHRIILDPSCLAESPLSI